VLLSCSRRPVGEATRACQLRPRFAQRSGYSGNVLLSVVHFATVVRNNLSS